MPPPEPPPPGAPGPFAFADPERVTALLEGAGFSEVQLAAQPVAMHFGDNSTLPEAVTDLVRIGPLSRLLSEQPADVQQQVIDALVVSMASCYRDGALHMPGSVWFVTARADSAG